MFGLPLLLPLQHALTEYRKLFGRSMDLLVDDLVAGMRARGIRVGPAPPPPPPATRLWGLRW